jgi:hypothetical protein
MSLGRRRCQVPSPFGERELTALAFQLPSKLVHPCL